MDLLGGERSWGDAFNTYTFSDLWKEQMQRYDLKYQCNDSRDDFSNSESNGNAAPPLPFTIGDDGEPADACSDLEDAVDSEDVVMDDGEDEDDPIERDTREWTTAHKNEVYRREDFERILRRAGWYTASSDPAIASAAASLPMVNTDGSATHWANTVKTAKTRVQEERKSGGRTTKSAVEGSEGAAASSAMTDDDNGDVFVADKSYLRQDWRPPKKGKEDMELIIKDFTLNKEQQ